MPRAWRVCRHALFFSPVSGRVLDHASMSCAMGRLIVLLQGLIWLHHDAMITSMLHAYTC